MEEINGVTFKDYACANANMAAGMPIDDVCKVLGLEVPVWEDTMTKWGDKMAELSPDDMIFFGEVFTNPKQGKFANVEFVSGVEVVLEKYPEWSDMIKMQQYSAAASDVGVDIDFDKEFGITITEYSQLAMHWSAYYKEKVMDVDNQTSREMLDDVAFSDAQVEKHRVFTLHNDLSTKWEAHYKELFKDKNVGLSDDIEF